MKIIPKGCQLLFYPMQNNYIGAGFKNALYQTDPNHKFTHFGVDYSCYAHGTFDIYASGNGTVLDVERNTNSLGYVFVIRYNNVFNPTTNTTKDYIFRYMHLASCNIKKGDSVTRDTKLGKINSRHQWYNHLHLEIDTDVKSPFHTPQVAEQSSLLFIRAGANDSTMIDPVDLLVIGNKQTAIVHPLAKYVSTKDTPKHKESNFLNEVIAPIAPPTPPVTANKNYQELVLPNNYMRITCSYKNAAYVTKFNIGEHRGFDFVGVNDFIMYASGIGEVLSTGFDSCFGNFVVIRYNNVINHKTKKVQDVVFRYFHFASFSVNKGDKTTKDTRIGVMGSTGTYSSGVHCHLEADTDCTHWNYTPTLKGSTTHFKAGYRDYRDSTFNPMDVLHIKASPPDNQKLTRNMDIYTHASDLDIPKIF